MRLSDAFKGVRRPRIGRLDRNSVVLRSGSVRRPERAKHSGGAEHATIIHPTPPTIWFSCRPVRRKKQDGAKREAPRTAVRRTTQGGA